MAEIGRAYRKKSMFLQCVSQFRRFRFMFLLTPIMNSSPDKNPGVKGVQERFARLGVVATILRSEEGRERSVSREITWGLLRGLMKVTCCLECRYDFFHKNGVPRWRGTGYYYSRFRPGLGVCRQLFFYASILTWAAQTVLVFLTLLSTGLHYLIQHMNYKRDLARVDHIISQAKQAAWGPKMLPVGGRRKVGFLRHFHWISSIHHV